MSEYALKTTESKATKSDRGLYAKSVHLRNYSNALLREAGYLRYHSQRLRAVNGLIADTNSNGNARRHREGISTIASRYSLRPLISFSIDIPLRGLEQNSDKSLNVLHESKVLY